MKTSSIESISEGTVTSPRGFHAGVTCASIKPKNVEKPDLGILYSSEPCVVAGMFTKNKVKSGPVVISQQRVKNGRACAIVANSGCANACLGEQGLTDASEMTELVAKNLGIDVEDVLVASTGVIGRPLPMENIRKGIGEIVLSEDGGHDMARAIMTTDTVSKEIAISVNDGTNQYTIGGIAKGSGMIHPDMATMLCFITTDIKINHLLLKKALEEAVDISLNMISVDGDTSPSDTTIIMANGMAGSVPIQEDSAEDIVFQRALNHVCIYLAKAIARDGEGATKLIEINVNGAVDETEARQAARMIVNSPLIKSAIYGCDPNWGRIIGALGRSGVAMEESKLDLDMGGYAVVRGGVPAEYDEEDVVEVLKQDYVTITINLNLDTGSATAWGCDLTEEYVVINSQYTT